MNKINHKKECETCEGKEEIVAKVDGYKYLITCPDCIKPDRRTK